MQLDFQRYEMKYAIPERLSSSIRDFIAAYTEPDPFTQKRAGGYVINSLYLDSPQLTFHLAKERKSLNRLKLRIRTYGEQADGEVFFEIKRKIKGVIFKQRVQVHSGVSQQPVDPWNAHPSQRTPRNHQVLGEFQSIAELHTAGPSMVVRYTREAYESLLDDYGRVTFDRVLEGHLPEGYGLYFPPGGWLALDDAISMELPRATILELKFAGTAPQWMVDLVQFFGLQRRGFSKYSTAVHAGLACYRPGEGFRALSPHGRGG